MCYDNVIPQLPPKSTNMDIKGTVTDNDLATPYLAENLLASKDLIGLREE